MRQFMNKLKLVFTLILACSLSFSRAQTRAFDQQAEATFAFGKSRGSLSLYSGRDWRLFKKKKFIAGIGLRFTAFAATNLYHTTAPAKLTSGSEGPLVIFKDNLVNNIDTLLVNKSQVNALNFMVNLGYRFNDRFQAGFNIDAIGFSSGKKQTGNYINGNSGQFIQASPSPFNLLLISDNDLGTLNSELYIRYFFNSQWAMKVAAQFLFTEYTTKSKVQQFPEMNDRFRNKSLMLGLGITRKF